MLIANKTDIIQLYSCQLFTTSVDTKANAGKDQSQHQPCLLFQSHGHLEIIIAEYFAQCSIRLSINNQTSTGLFSLLHELREMREFSLRTSKKILKFGHLDCCLSTVHRFMHSLFLCGSNNANYSRAKIKPGECLSLICVQCFNTNKFFTQQ